MCCVKTPHLAPGPHLRLVVAQSYSIDGFGTITTAETWDKSYDLKLGDGITDVFRTVDETHAGEKLIDLLGVVVEHCQSVIKLHLMDFSGLSDSEFVKGPGNMMRIIKDPSLKDDDGPLKWPGYPSKANLEGQHLQYRHPRMILLAWKLHNAVQMGVGRSPKGLWVRLVRPRNGSSRVSLAENVPKRGFPIAAKWFDMVDTVWRIPTSLMAVLRYMG